MLSTLRLRLGMLLLWLMLGGPVCAMDIADADSVASDTVCADNVRFASLPWYRQLVDNGFRINDPRMNYPRFVRWCVNVYNWGDRTFNSYDPDYVVATGKNWKFNFRSFNWSTNYAMMFTDKTMLRMESDLYSDLGAYLSFMAVSAGYTLNANQYFNHTTNNRKNFNFSFVCALFSANFNYSTSQGGVKIKHFGDYMKGRHFSYDFNDINMKTIEANAYYFFNHRRYAQAAAYCYSKYQLRSAGSWIIGLSYSHQNIGMDFSSLPPEMLVYLPTLKPVYNFHYADYDVMGGYAYNWVLHPRRWLVNITTLPSVGYKHSYEDATEGSKSMFSTNIRAMLGVVYNHRSMFASLNGTFDGHLYFSSDYTFFNSISTFSLNVGFRF